MITVILLGFVEAGIIVWLLIIEIDLISGTEM